MDVTANMVTSTQLTTWMQNALKKSQATADQWCYAMDHILPNSCKTLPDAVLIACGMKADFSNRGTLPQISADAFLNALRTYQLNVNASTQGPGAHTGTINPTTTPSTPAPGTGASSGSASNNTGTGGQPASSGQPGTGVLGPTNCTTCQALASNPALLLLLAVAAYFFFFKK